MNSFYEIPFAFGTISWSPFPHHALPLLLSSSIAAFLFLLISLLHINHLTINITEFYTSSTASSPITPTLQSIICQIAANGSINLPWDHVKKLLEVALLQLLQRANEAVAGKDRLLAVLKYDSDEWWLSVALVLLPFVSLYSHYYIS
jgi:hypothetical protein